MKWYVHALWILVWRDIRTEFRGKQLVVGGASFGLLLVFIIGMALDGTADLPADWSAGMMWVSVFFASSITMTRHAARDTELGALQGLLLVPCDRSILFYARWLSSSLFVTLIAVVTVGAFFVILNQPVPLHPVVFSCVMLFGSVVLTGLENFLAVLTTASSMRDVLLPILLFPLGIPLFLAVIRLTAFSFQGSAGLPFVWLQVLGGYLVIVAVLPWLLYEALLEV